MKKKVFLLFILFCMNTIFLVSQNSDKQNEIIKKELKPLLNSEFTKIITGNSFTNFGRYIGVSTTDKSLNLSGVTVKDLEIWSYKISAGANNGFATLFNGLELNTNVGAEFTYNNIVNIFTKKIKIGNKNRVVTTNLIARNSKINNWERVEKEKLYTQYKSDSIDVVNKKELIDATYKINKLKNKIDELRIRKLKNKLTKDSVNYAIQRAVFDYNSIRKQIAILSNPTYTATALRKLKTNLNEEYNKISELKLEKSEVRILDLTWFSVGYGLNNKSFNLFDESQPIEEQINNDSYLSHQFNIGLSRYRKDRLRNTNFYWSLGLNLKLTNNLSELTTKEVIDTEIISQDPLREIQSKKEVFIGNYKKGHFPKKCVS